jgi:hypothetical protein
VAAELRLEVRDYTDSARWRWVLTDGAGAFIKDHEVRLDPNDWQFEAFTNLAGYLSWHVAPDRRREDEARIVTEVGQWIGSQVLSPVAQALPTRRPATVTVTVPDQARGLLFLPLELAHAGGKPLPAQRNFTWSGSSSRPTCCFLSAMTFLTHWKPTSSCSATKLSTRSSR